MQEVASLRDGRRHLTPFFSSTLKRLAEFVTPVCRSITGERLRSTSAHRRGRVQFVDRRRHIGKPDDAPEMLERLEQDQERQARAGLARPLPRESDLGRPRRERFQLDRPWLGGQPRVGGVCDDRHGARSRLRRRKRWDRRGRLDAGLF